MRRWKMLRMPQLMVAIRTRQSERVVCKCFLIEKVGKFVREKFFHWSGEYFTLSPYLLAVFNDFPRKKESHFNFSERIFAIYALNNFLVAIKPSAKAPQMQIQQTLAWLLIFIATLIRIHCISSVPKWTVNEMSHNVSYFEYESSGVLYNCSFS